MCLCIIDFIKRVWGKIDQLMLIGFPLTSLINTRAPKCQNFVIAEIDVVLDASNLRI